MREYAENYTHRTMITRTATMILPRFPPRTIHLPLGKVQSLTSINYRNTAGVQTLLAASAYQSDFTDDEDPVVIPARGTVWPTTDWESIAPLTIVWQAGYGGKATSVPAVMRHAMLLQAARWYEARWEGETAIRSRAWAPAGDDMFHQAIAPYILYHA